MIINTKFAGKYFVLIIVLVFISLFFPQMGSPEVHAGGVNIAKDKLMPGGKGVGYSSQISPNVAEYAVDGDSNTFWRHNNDDSDKDGSVWIRLDLGQPEAFNKARLVFITDTTGIPYFKINYSNDAINWINGFTSSGTLDKDAEYYFNQINARYVELIIYFSYDENGNTQRIDFGEFKLFHEANLAKGKLMPGGKDIGYSSQLSPNVAENAVDGSTGTFWRHHIDDSNNDGSVWIRLDLEQPKTFNKARLVFITAPTRNPYFEINYSNDAVNWTNCFTSNETLAKDAEYTFETVTARYVELKIYFNFDENGETQRIDFAEFKLHNVANLAKNKLMPGGKNVGYSSQMSPNIAENAVDGDYSTFWRHHIDDSNNDGIVWIRLDMEQAKTFNKAMLTFETNPDRNPYFEINYSNDTMNWTNGFTSSVPLTKMGEYTFSPITARYVELKIFFSFDSQGQTERIDVSEFALYDAGDTTPPVWPPSAGLTASNLTPNGVFLSWPAASDDVGIASYEVYLNGALHAKTTGSECSVNIGGLIPGTTYVCKVEAGDASGNWSINGPSTTVTTPSYNQTEQKTVGNLTYNFKLPAGAKIEEIDENTWIIPGDAIFVLNDEHLIITPTGDQERPNQCTKATMPRIGDEAYSNLERFPVIGYIGVLDGLQGGGYVVLLEEFGHYAPTINGNNDGFIINNAAKLRIVFFENGGYNTMAQTIRQWLILKDYYRNIFDKPYGNILNGAAVMRPVQFGAIGREVWLELVDVVPKAILIWKIGDGQPERYAGLEKFTVQLQAEIDQLGEYYFLPFCGMQKPVINEEIFDKFSTTYFDWFSFASMPQSFLDQWKAIVNNQPYDPNGNGRYLINPYGLRQRIEYWLYEKMPQHPHTYRTDGANVDTMPFWFCPENFRVCENPGYTAGFKEMVQGYEEMFKEVYDNEGIISHEGTAFFLEKYSHSGYGRPLLTIGSLSSGWGLDDPGKLKDPNDVLELITKNVPINALVYHDQIAMRIHDGEALNMRYGNEANTNLIRKYKILYYALFGLTPNIQLGGDRANQWVTDDLVWMRAQMPKILETYSKTYGQRIVEHKYLTADKLVQQCTYENGIRVTANFDSVARTAGNLNLNALSYILEEL